MFDRTEAEVTRDWQGDPVNPVVSICCIAYNHQDYIARAIDGLLAQETTFPFEILIHDDASTDGTANIVRQYEDAFPNIIRTVLQKENQYSSEPIIAPRFLFPLVKGRYTALCEGDDYWCSSEKLARQCETLDAHPDVDLSFHPVFELNVVNGASRLRGRWYRAEKCISTTAIVLGGGGFCRTPSVLFRSSLIPQIQDCVRKAPFGDKFIQIVTSLNGGALYMPEAMAVYRIGHQGTWTQRIKNVAAIRAYEDRVSYPYQWLYENCATDLLPILEFSESDQYTTIARQYIRAEKFQEAKKTLARSSRIFPKNRVLAGLIRWAASGPIRLKSYVAIYPAVRTLYRFWAKMRSAGQA